MDNIGIMTWSLTGGGAERAVANLSRDLSKMYRVYIFCFDTSVITYPYEGEIIDVGIGVGESVVQKSVIAIKRVNLIKRLKKKYQLKAMISYMPQLNVYNVITKTKERVIISIRNNMTEKGLSRIGNYLLRWTGKKADCTVSLSEGVRRDLIDNFGFYEEKVITIYNSCDRMWFLKENMDVERIAKGIDFSKPSLACVGRLTYQKGHWHLIRALSLVKKQIPDCQLLIFGQGEYLEDLKVYSERLNVSENIYFMGYIKNHHTIMQKCDVFVFPSIFEGLGNVLLEALACGMPVISTDCPSGPREILCNEANSVGIDIEKTDYGILIPPFSKKTFDVDDVEFERSDYLLADAIVQLLSNNDLLQHYKQKSFERAEFFMPDNVNKMWEKVIEGKL